jgi:hypothetical protein
LKNNIKSVVGVVMLLFGVFLATHTPWQLVPDPIQGGLMLMNEPVLLYAIFGSWLYVCWAVVWCIGNGKQKL